MSKYSKNVNVVTLHKYFLRHSVKVVNCLIVSQSVLWTSLLSLLIALVGGQIALPVWERMHDIQLWGTVDWVFWTFRKRAKDQE